MCPQPLAPEQASSVEISIKHSFSHWGGHLGEQKYSTIEMIPNRLFTEVKE